MFLPGDYFCVVNNTGLAVFLDFKYAIERLGEDVVRARYGNLFDMYEEITDENPYKTPMMHFPDQSTFGRYFKHHMACSPGEYRKATKP